MAWNKIKANRFLSVAIAFVTFNTLFLSVIVIPYQTWWSQQRHMQVAPLMTNWSATIDPNNVLPDYPRPQLARTEWLNLNGVWAYCPGFPGDNVPAKSVFAGKILVPFAVESAISGVMQHYDRLWYRREFTIPASWAGKHVLLHFGAVDWEARVFVNGIEIGMHRGGYDPFSFDITTCLHDGKNELVVGVYDPTDAGTQPVGKQSLNPGGILYTAVTGIWQTVWLEPVSENHIDAISLVPDIDKGQLNITANVTGSASVAVSVQATALNGTAIVGQASGMANSSFPVPITSPDLWSPSNPFLYNLTIVVKNGSSPIDTVSSYFGMRKIAVATVDGQPKICLNNNFLFEMGTLDQCWWPDGLYTAPCDAALRWDIETAKELGLNMLRIHQVVEPDRFYYLCDRLGLLLWQDMPAGKNTGADGQAEFTRELQAMIACRDNHPSIIMWTLFNEGWGQFDTVNLTTWVKHLDPSRLVSCASGWNDYEVGDIKDAHSYPDPSCPTSATRAVVNGEFGGIGWPIPGHEWTAGGWGYTTVSNQTTFDDTYARYLTEVQLFANVSGLSAAVYTQLTDVEQEMNGLITFDRQVIKPDIALARAANQFPTSPHAFLPMLNTSETVGQPWNYTTSTPPGAWMSPAFDDSSWAHGIGGFGTSFTPGSAVRTTWSSSDIWLKRYFNPGNINATARANLWFRVHHDEDVEIYINGVLACSATGYTTSYVYLPMNQGGRTAMLANITNVIAVHCHQTTGGQYIDAGIYDLVPA
ncbi:MAG TPA: glycoside hydrolase family 2 TIM barrel-domain containing protein [Candidatus Lokiarchaeia archaeon]|nr:glycoside hydrolase family 2 TIM barrel-domain containing protein [Candidatus Lokiarchaeia archaeon]